MKSYSKIIFFALLIIPAGTLSQEVNRGDFGVFVPSLVASPKSYSVIKDPTLTSPTKSVEKFELKNGSCSKIPSWDDCKTDRERVELKEKNESEVASSTRWYGWSFYFPKNFESVWPVKLSIAQFFDDKNDSPAWMFQVNNNGLELENFVLKKNNLTNLLHGPELRERWHKVELEILWAKDVKGIFNVWVNGQQKLSYKGPTILKGPYFFKYGLYRSFLSRWKKSTPIPTQQIYFSNVKMGSTRKSLLP